jgi:hypothetical protein
MVSVDTRFSWHNRYLYLRKHNKFDSKKKKLLPVPSVPCPSRQFALGCTCWCNSSGPYLKKQPCIENTDPKSNQNYTDPQSSQNYRDKNIILNQCCGSGSWIRCFFIPPGSGMNFFRIPDRESQFRSPFFGEIFLHYLMNPCYVIFMKLGYS